MPIGADETNVWAAAARRPKTTLGIGAIGLVGAALGVLTGWHNLVTAPNTREAAREVIREELRNHAGQYHEMHPKAGEYNVKMGSIDRQLEAIWERLRQP